MDFVARTDSNEYGFPLWTPTEQHAAEMVYSPRLEEDSVKVHVRENRLKVTPWEADNQPAVSVLHSFCQEAAYAVTDHLFKTWGLCNPGMASPLPFLFY
jgi:hypothetical protein